MPCVCHGRPPKGWPWSPDMRGIREVGGADEPGGEDAEPLEGVWPLWAGCLGCFAFRTLHTHGPVPAPLHTGAPALAPHPSLCTCSEAPAHEGVQFPGKWSPVLDEHFVLLRPQSRQSKASLLHRQTHESGMKESVSWGTTQRAQEVPYEARTPLERGHSTEIPVMQSGRPVRRPPGQGVGMRQEGMRVEETRWIRGGARKKVRLGSMVGVTWWDHCTPRLWTSRRRAWP